MLIEFWTDMLADVLIDLLLIDCQDFIAKCLEKEPKKRPTARELLFHPVLFEVHSLKLLSAHKYIKSTSQYYEFVQWSALSFFGAVYISYQCSGLFWLQWSL